MPYSHVQQVHNSVGKANPRKDFITRTLTILNYATRVCKVLQELDALATRMNRLYCVIQ